MILLILLLAGTHSQLASTPPSPPPTCDVDPQVLDLSAEAFDQRTKGGWRELANQTGCEEKAAQLLRVYRARYLARIPILYWHEGQLRALIGDDKEAASLMAQSRAPEDQDLFGWNPYVDATIAFLRKDKAAFSDAERRLWSQKRPEGWHREWPQNANVVIGLRNCFEKSYKIAYGSECR